MGLALHEIYEVLGLVIGDAPYEEYVLSTEELHLLKKRDPLVYETYWGSAVPLPHLRVINWMAEQGSQADVIGDLSVPRGEQGYHDVPASSQH